jgi:hypothetical protein
MYLSRDRTAYNKARPDIGTQLNQREDKRKKRKVKGRGGSTQPQERMGDKPKTKSCRVGNGRRPSFFKGLSLVGRDAVPFDML